MRAPLSMRSYVYTPHHTTPHQYRRTATPITRMLLLHPPQTHRSRGGCGVADYLVGKDAAYGREKLHESADMAGGGTMAAAVSWYGPLIDLSAAAAAPGTRARD